MIKLSKFHIENFDWFVDREKNKPCLVAGCAPNIVNFPFDRFKGVYITMGDGPFRLAKYFTPDYWVSANTIFPIPEVDLEKINSLKKTVYLFADSVAYAYRNIDLDFLANNIKVTWFNYDQRHFNQTPCPKSLVRKNNSQCCKMLEVFPGRETIQEFVQRLFKRNGHYSTASTVAIHALAFAIIMGCDPIFIHGVEIPKYEKDYRYPKNKKVDKFSVLKLKPDLSGPLPVRYLKIFKHLVSRTWLYKTIVRKKSEFYPDIPEIIRDFDYLANIAAANNRKIYRLSTTTILRKIKNIEYRAASAI